MVDHGRVFREGRLTEANSRLASFWDISYCAWQIASCGSGCDTFQSNLVLRSSRRSPSVRRPLSSAAGADLVSQASRTFPPRSASVDLAHLRPACGRIGHATRSTSPEREAEGDLSPSLPAVYEAQADVTRFAQPSILD